MASDVDICNLALAHLGDEATVSSLSPPEGSVQAEHCAKFYPIARDALLEMHDWRFATTRKALVELSEEPPAGWLLAYAKPASAIKIIAVLAEGATDEGQAEDFIVEALNNGTPAIFTNVEGATARYTFRPDSPQRFSAGFVDALARLLASYMAGPLIKGTAGVQMSRQLYQHFLVARSLAIATDANQRHGEPAHTPAWIGDR